MLKQQAGAILEIKMSPPRDLKSAGTMILKLPFSRRVNNKFTMLITSYNQRYSVTATTLFHYCFSLSWILELLQLKWIKQSMWPHLKWVKQVSNVGHKTILRLGLCFLEPKGESWSSDLPTNQLGNLGKSFIPYYKLGIPSYILLKRLRII